MCPRLRPHTDPGHLFAAYIFTFTIINCELSLSKTLLSSHHSQLSPRVTGQCVSVSFVFTCISVSRYLCVADHKSRRGRAPLIITVTSVGKVRLRPWGEENSDVLSLICN